MAQDAEASVPFEAMLGADVVTIVLGQPGTSENSESTFWSELLAEIHRLSRETSIRAVVLTGKDRSFLTSSEFTSTIHDDVVSVQREVQRGAFHEVCVALHRLPQPTIAKVRGVASGIGLDLAMACDLVVAADNARFSVKFFERGLTVDDDRWLLPSFIGSSQAMQLALFPEMVSANRMASMGLVNRVLPDADLDQFVDDWIGRLAAGAPIALAMSKQLLNDSLAVTLEQALDNEAISQTVNLGTNDYAEALLAFLERRDPKFEGR